MAVGAGYSATVKVSGTSTAMTDEPCTIAGDGLTAQVTNTAKRIIDPAVAVTVKLNAAPLVLGTDYTLGDAFFLFGTVTFTSAINPATDDVVVTANYLPTHAVLLARKYEVNATRAELEATNYDSSGVETYLAGKKGASGSIEILDIAETDLDGGAGSIVLATLMDAGTPKLLEVTPGGSSTMFRCWVIFTSKGMGGSVADLESTTLKWVQAAQAGTASGSGMAGHGWGS